MEYQVQFNNSFKWVPVVSEQSDYLTELEAFQSLVKVMKNHRIEDPNNFRVVRIVPAHETVLG